MFMSRDKRKEKWHVRFVDFEWSCQDGQGVYPDDIYMKDTMAKRPVGVEAGQPVRKQHDREGLRAMLM